MTQRSKRRDVKLINGLGFRVSRQTPPTTGVLPVVGGVWSASRNFTVLFFLQDSPREIMGRKRQRVAENTAVIEGGERGVVSSKPE